MGGLSPEERLCYIVSKYPDPDEYVDHSWRVIPESVIRVDLWEHEYNIPVDAPRFKWTHEFYCTRCLEKVRK